MAVVWCGIDERGTWFMSNPEQKDGAFLLSLPADMSYLLVARMALSGFGMLAGLDVDQVDDLRTVVDECCDCLLHQGKLPQKFSIAAKVCCGRFCCSFTAEEREEAASADAQDYEVTRCILETLLPDVQLLCDEAGVYCIDVSMPL